jgi:hypothetical protein
MKAVILTTHNHPMRNGIKKLLLVIACLSPLSHAISQQINISRIEEMPSLPSPYIMRDWFDVARKYDSLVYDVSRTGSNLPLVSLGTSGINYPAVKPLLMDSYVGSSSHGAQAEAINIIPSLVGASLVGINKANQFGVNWVVSSKDFFNKRNGQNVYLNGQSANSGDDWWYDVMPNVFFYQLYSLYPQSADFDTQFTSIANVWKGAISKMGGSATPWKVPEMNYRAWNLSTQSPLISGVKEPEAAGSLGWLMYTAYKERGDKSYLYASQMGIDFLNGLTSNPSYEIQLPYGTLTAARINAEQGSDYDVEKMLNWVFNRGPLRGWGTITGTWNGNDVSGLVGEANDAGDDYAFVMNGFQQAAALIPLVKYDKRFARAIAKWTLNMANASRLFYTDFLPADHQDSYAWSIQYDPSSVIAHESLKQVWNNIDLFARGDAILGGWSTTNLALYGSSHAGYLGAIVHKTNVDAILLLDVNKTDFFGDNTFPRYLVYNPYNTGKSVTLPLGSADYDIYDAISEKIILHGATGNPSVPVGPDSVKLLVYLPSGSVLREKGRNLYAGNGVVDYHYRYNFEGLFRIKSLAARKSTIQVGLTDSVYCTVDNVASSVLYSWTVNGALVSSGNKPALNWTAPSTEGSYEISCKVSSGGQVATDTVIVEVVSLIPEKPRITSLQGDEAFYLTQDTADLTIIANDPNGSALKYKWSAGTGAFQDSLSSSAKWITSSTPGVYEIWCHVENDMGLFSDTSLFVLVKSRIAPDINPLVYYPFDGNVKDYSGNGYDAVLSGAAPATDALGNPQRAYRFSSSADLIYTPDRSELNFQDKIAVSFWLRIDQVPEETYVISHGSWEERYKVSVTPEKRLRWTIKTDIGTKDLDNSTVLPINEFNHYTVCYTGYSMEIYVNGELDVFTSMSGKIQQTGKDLTIGHKDRTTNSYFLRGTLDEIKIFNGELPVSEIKILPSLWNPYTGFNSLNTNSIQLFPNPTEGYIYLKHNPEESPLRIDAFDITGQQLKLLIKEVDNSTTQINMVNPVHGVVLMKIQFRKGEEQAKVIFR